MIKKYIARFIASLGAFAPTLALAAGEFNKLNDFVGNILDFINGTLVPLIFAVAFLIFLWGIFKYFILGGDDEDKRKEGRNLMMYGIGGFVVMVSVWGIVNLLAGGLGLQDQELLNVPNAIIN